MVPFGDISFGDWGAGAGATVVTPGRSRVADPRGRLSAPCVALAVVVAACPRSAFAFDGTAAASAAVPIALILVLAVIALLRSERQRAALQTRLERKEQALAAIEAVGPTGPIASLTWDAIGGRQWSPGAVAGLTFSAAPEPGELAARFLPADGAALGAAIEALRRDGTEFALTLMLASAGAVDAIGRRAVV